MTDHYLKNQLGKNEQIIFVTRQHWLVLLGQILAASQLALGLVILITFIWWIWLPNSLVPLAYLLLLLPLLSMGWNLLIWTSRQYIVTDWRVIQICGVFNKEVTDSSLEKVNDVKREQSFWGWLPLLNKGEVKQTSSYTSVK